MDNIPNSKFPEISQQQIKKVAKVLTFSVSIPLVITGGYFLFNNRLPQAATPIKTANHQLSPNEPFRNAVNQAMRAAIATQSAKSDQEWNQVASHWQNAITLMKNVPSDSPKYAIARSKIVDYQRNFNYAISKIKVPQTQKTSSSEPFRDAVNQAMQAAVLTQSAKSQSEWDQVASHWRNAIALMKIVPISSPKYTLAQQKVALYQRNLDYAMRNLHIDAIAKESLPQQLQSSSDPFRDGVNQAMRAAMLTQTAKSRSQWQQVSTHWQQAIASMKNVPTSYPKYNIAQQRVGQYQQNLDYAVQQLQNSFSLMRLAKTIIGGLTPKSVVYSGGDLFFAQNMMYSHTIKVYNRDYQLVKSIPDQVDLSKYGYKKFKGIYRGAPVEAAFSETGKYAWISNYQMYGAGFNNPGSDQCSPASNHDPSFLYRVNTESFEIERVIQVGAVPKFVATSPDNRLVLVSNWCTWDLSIIDTQKNSEIRRIKLGAYPRGIVVTPDSQTAYIAVMGSSNIAMVNLQNYSVDWLKNIGSAPRHLNMDSAGKYLYATLNNEGRVAKIDLETRQVLAKVVTGQAPRSMTLSGDGKFLYVVNYHSNTMSKVRTSDMKVVQTVNVNSSPIGITYDPKTKSIWVACYSGSILVFQE